MLHLKKLFGVLIVMVTVFVACTKEANIEPPPVAPPTELVAEGCLDCAMPFGRWYHFYGVDNRSLYVSELMMDSNMSIPDNDPRSELYDFLKSTSAETLYLYHNWNGMGQIENSTNPFFVVVWEYSEDKLSGAFLIERESGRFHTLMVNEPLILP